MKFPLSIKPLLNLSLVALSSLQILGASAVQAEDGYLEDFSLEAILALDTLVTTLSRAEESRDLAPGAIYAFDAELIRKRGYRSLAELLQTIPGFTTMHKHLHVVAGVRGLNANENEKITLMINGRESNNVQEPDFLNGPINLQTLERVEIVVGPSSFFEQGNTLAATINIITKKVDGAEVSLAAGNDLPYSVNVAGGKRWSEDGFVSASLSLERKDGFDAWDENNRPNLAGYDDTGRLDPSYFGVVEAQFGNLWGQVIAYESDHPELNLLNKLDGDGNRLYDGTYSDVMYLLNLKYHLDISDDLTFDAWLNVGHKEVTRLNDETIVASGLELEYPQRDRSLEFAFEYSGIEDHYVYAGIQYTNEDNLENTDFQNGLKSTLISDSNDTNAVGVYLYNRWQATENFRVEGGLRADKNNILDDNNRKLGGRFSFSYTVQDDNYNWITKFLINRAVRFPSPIAALNECWGAGNTCEKFDANPVATKPEILTTAEWQNILYVKDTRLSVNIYKQELKDFISWIGPHTNVGNFTGTGIELEVKYILTERGTLWANTSKFNSELEPIADVGAKGVNGDNEIIGSPGLTFNAGLDFNVTDKLSLFGTLRYMTDQTAFNQVEGEFEKIDDIYYLDFSATYSKFMHDDINIGLNFRNLLDNRDHVSTQWSKTQYKPRGRSVVLAVSYSFF
ncbi:MAG: hypothetical protein COB04_04355 [Gammaproteobacteria bacterium]|nr:MAG: hypothetical protein COB04_04355 [Gammaproteobacteria bacterium]